MGLTKRWAIAFAMVGLVAMAATPAGAATNYQWDDGAAADSFWNSAENWNDDIVPVNLAGDRVTVSTGKTIDLNGATVSLPDMNVRIDSTLLDTPGGGSITCAEYKVQGWSSSMYPTINATTVVANYRVGTTNWYGAVNAATIDLSSGNHYFYNDMTATVEVKAVDGPQGDPDLYLRPNSATPAVIPTLTTPKFTVSGQRERAFIGGTIVTDEINVLSSGKYFAETANSLGNASTNVSIGTAGYLAIQTAQTAFPQISVGSFGILSGDMTGATFGAGGNVSFTENSVYVPVVASATPLTRADVGGGILWEGMTSDKTVYHSGNDGVSPFKGVAIGHWTNSTVGGFTVHALPGSGAPQMLIANSRDKWGNTQFGGGTIFIGDNNGTPADTSDDIISAGITARNDSEAPVRLTYALNQNVDYAEADNVYVTTFDVMGITGNETRNLLVSAATRELVRPEQTINVYNGRIAPSHWSKFEFGGNMHGTLTLTDGQFDQPNANMGFDDEDGHLSFHGTVVFEFNDASWAEFLEPLEDRFSYDADARIVVKMGNNDQAAIDYDPYGLNPVLADLLVNADVTHSSYGVTRLGGDLLLGHGKYLIGSMDQPNSNGFDTTVGAVISPAGNAPEGTQATLGFAAHAADMPVNVAIDAADATVVVGCSDPDRILYTATGGFENVTPTKRVWFKQTIVAEELEVQTGTARLAQDLDINTIDLHADGTLQLDGGRTATVSGSLTGNGTFTGGNGIVIDAGASIAPGASVGTLTSSTLLTMADGAIYELEIGDTAGVAGVSSDLVFGTGFDFDFDDDLDGAMTIKINSSTESDVAIAATDEFVLFATNNGTVEIPDVWTISFDATGLNTELAELTLMNDYTDVNGDSVPDDCLVLTGMVGVAKPSSTGGIMGDANGDGLVDDNDLSLLLANWGKSTDWGHGEFSGEAPVNDNDLSLLLANWTGSGSAGIAVPEPTSLALLGLGALVTIRRRRR